ncbi:unnamed protein product [Polarella glacialis]|uniref:Uncharacterized protein n=1 Tax=Polarella glacialis TaxID=89957 RepID=A0A813FLE8_POLGL|nr:unnamed protein product [Polarella glacialis]
MPLDNEMPALPPGMYTQDSKHGMAPPDVPGAMYDGPRSERPGGTPRSFGPATPPAGPGTPGGGVGGFGYSPAPSHRSFASSLGRTPGPSLPMVPVEQTMPLFIRGQPPPMQPSPFMTQPPGPGGMMPWQVPPGMSPPGMGTGGRPMMPPGAPTLPMVPPAPPPPPREDDQAFVRRIRLTYMEKVYKEHDKHDLLEDLDELGTETPG